MDEQVGFITYQHDTRKMLPIFQATTYDDLIPLSQIRGIASLAIENVLNIISFE